MPSELFLIGIACQILLYNFLSQIDSVHVFSVFFDFKYICNLLPLCGLLCFSSMNTFFVTRLHFCLQLAQGIILKEVQNLHADLAATSSCLFSTFTAELTTSIKTRASTYIRKYMEAKGSCYRPSSSHHYQHHQRPTNSSNQPKASTATQHRLRWSQTRVPQPSRPSFQPMEPSKFVSLVCTKCFDFLSPVAIPRVKESLFCTPFPQQQIYNDLFWVLLI